MTGQGSSSTPKVGTALQPDWWMQIGPDAIQTLEELVDEVQPNPPPPPPPNKSGKFKPRGGGGRRRRQRGGGGLPVEEMAVQLMHKGGKTRVGVVEHSAGPGGAGRKRMVHRPPPVIEVSSTETSEEEDYAWDSEDLDARDLWEQIQQHLSMLQDQQHTTTTSSSSINKRDHPIFHNNNNNKTSAAAVVVVVGESSNDCRCPSSSSTTGASAYTHTTLNDLLSVSSSLGVSDNSGESMGEHHHHQVVVGGGGDLGGQTTTSLPAVEVYNKTIPVASSVGTVHLQEVRRLFNLLWIQQEGRIGAQGIDIERLQTQSQNLKAKIAQHQQDVETIQHEERQVVQELESKVKRLQTELKQGKNKEKDQLLLLQNANREIGRLQIYSHKLQQARIVQHEQQDHDDGTTKEEEEDRKVVVVQELERKVDCLQKELEQKKKKNKDDLLLLEDANREIGRLQSHSQNLQARIVQQEQEEQQLVQELQIQVDRLQRELEQEKKKKKDDLLLLEDANREIGRQQTQYRNLQARIAQQEDDGTRKEEEEQVVRVLQVKVERLEKDLQQEKKEKDELLLLQDADKSPVRCRTTMLVSGQAIAESEEEEEQDTRTVSVDSPLSCRVISLASGQGKFPMLCTVLEAEEEQEEEDTRNNLLSEDLQVLCKDTTLATGQGKWGVLMPFMVVPVVAAIILRYVRGPPPPKELTDDSVVPDVGEKK